jgi:hypothetical protein
LLCSFSCLLSLSCHSLHLILPCHDFVYNPEHNLNLNSNPDPNAYPKSPYPNLYPNSSPNSDLSLSPILTPTLNLNPTLTRLSSLVLVLFCVLSCGCVSRKQGFFNPHFSRLTYINTEINGCFTIL